MQEVATPAAMFQAVAFGDADGMVTGVTRNYSTALSDVRRVIDARPGHIVVALIEGEVVVKRYELIGQRPYLSSGNALYPPIAIFDLECQVWGVVRCVIHEYAV